MSITLQRERMERASAPPMRELADQAFSRAAGARATMQVVVVNVESGAEGGSRTRTSFRTTDFKSRDGALT
jgi:hypothetical protein